MTETLERPRYETPVLAKTGLQKERAIAELGDVTPWDSGDGSEAYELGASVEPAEGDESESGKLELSTNVLDDRVIFIKMPVSETENDETQYKIFRVGADGSGMTWLNEVSVGEDGQWGTELSTRDIIANSGQETTVGRSEDTPNALHVDGQLVSRVQFRITGEKGGKLTIESGAMNGVEVVIAKERKRDPVQDIKLVSEPRTVMLDAATEMAQQNALIAQARQAADAARRVVTSTEGQVVAPLEGWNVARGYQDVAGFGRMSGEAVALLDSISGSVELSDDQRRAVESIARTVSENNELIQQMNLGIDTTKIYRLTMARNAKALIPELRSAVQNLSRYGTDRAVWLENGSNGASAIKSVTEAAFAKLFNASNLSPSEQARMRDTIYGQQ